MKVGTQHGDSDQILRAMAGFGVNHICSRLPSVRLDDKWSVDSLSRFREHVESFGITLDMVPLPMSSNDISRFELPNIMLGKSPDRDREIDDVCQMIRNTARAGIPSLKYNMTFLGVVRTESTRAAAAPPTARSSTTRPSRIRHCPLPARSAKTSTGSASRIS